MGLQSCSFGPCASLWPSVTTAQRWQWLDQSSRLSRFRFTHHRGLQDHSSTLLLGKANNNTTNKPCGGMFPKNCGLHCSVHRPLCRVCLRACICGNRSHCVWFLWCSTKSHEDEH